MIWVLLSSIRSIAAVVAIAGSMLNASKAMTVRAPQR